MQKKEYSHQEATAKSIELLSSEPKKAIRFGVISLCLLIFISLVLSWLIKYPDILSSDMTVTSITKATNTTTAQLSILLENKSQQSSTVSTQHDICKGQVVNLKMENYDERGILKGRVSSVSKKQHTDSCFITITLPEGFMTSFHKSISVKPGTKGKADIIIKKQSLMSKLISALKWKLSSF